MVQKFIIYCDGITEDHLIIDSDLLSFWSVQFKKSDSADIIINYAEHKVSIKGIDEEYNYDNNLSTLLHKVSPLDLSYIEQLFDVEEEQSDMLDLAKNELVENLGGLMDAMAINDSKQIKHYSHKMTSKLIVLSIPALEQCRFIEDNASNPTSSELRQHYQLLKMYCLICLWQIGIK